jgi:hypothetical protein
MPPAGLWRVSAVEKAVSRELSATIPLDRGRVGDVDPIVDRILRTARRPAAPTPERQTVGVSAFQSII